MFLRVTTYLLVLSGLYAVNASALEGKIIAHSLNAQGEGYTILKLWGTPHQMGYAQGTLLAQPIIDGVSEFKQLLGNMYPMLRTELAKTIWQPAEIEAELDGIVDGVVAAIPSSTVDKLDLKIINTYGDWSNAFACRSHSAWGDFVKSPTRTLSTRRLDYALPKVIHSVNHHVIVARQPTGGGIRWVNAAWPGFVSAVTAVNEFGTLASLHDYQSKVSSGAHMPRCIAVRYALTEAVKGLPLNQHLEAAYQALQKFSIATGTFINYFVPEGYGGVITCPSGKPCSTLRRPQTALFGGKVLITTNTETDGTSVPADGTFLESFYQQGGPKTLSDHYGIMGHSGMHLLSIAYRKRADISMWFEGRLSSGVTPTVKLEFSQLFDEPTRTETRDRLSKQQIGSIQSQDTQSPSKYSSGCSFGNKNTIFFAAAPLLVLLLASRLTSKSARRGTPSKSL